MLNPPDPPLYLWPALDLHHQHKPRRRLCLGLPRGLGFSHNLRRRLANHHLGLYILELELRDRLLHRRHRPGLLHPPLSRRPAPIPVPMPAHRDAHLAAVRAVGRRREPRLLRVFPYRHLDGRKRSSYREIPAPLNRRINPPTPPRNLQGIPHHHRQSQHHQPRPLQHRCHRRRHRRRHRAAPAPPAVLVPLPQELPQKAH